jgi:type III restriction enzyme
VQLFLLFYLEIFAFSPELAPHAENALQLIESVYDPKKNPMVSNARSKATLNLDREKFASKEFKQLWDRINAKTYYTVQFDEPKLVESCARAINMKLRASKTMVVITKGYLKSTNQDTAEMKKDLLGKEEIAARGVTYDLIGEIATVTRLTRKTVANILSGIEKAKFDLFKANPEEFIREAIKLIDEQKASTIIEHITYDTLDERWNAEEIFVDPTISGEYGKNLIDAKKHLFDKLRYDSTIEKDLATEMDVSENITVKYSAVSSYSELMNVVNR